MDNAIDFVILAGADWKYTVFVQNDPVNPANPTNPANAVNLRGCSAVLTAAGTPGASVKLFTLSSSDGSLVIDDTAGSVSWNMPASQTAQFSVPLLIPIPNLAGIQAYAFGYYTLKITNAAGAVMREFSGRLYLSPDA
jgi:hypothetical protein